MNQKQLNSARLVLPIAVALILAIALAGVGRWLLPVRAQQAPDRAAQTIQRDLQTRPDFPPIGVAYEKETPRSDAAQAAGACSKYMDPGSTLRGVTHVAVQENGICYNADIDTFVHAGRSYVVQAGGYDAAFTITDVSEPAAPQLVHQSTWDRAYTYTPDVKAFRQGNRPFIAISMERYSTSAYCGVVIYDVSNPTQPVLRSQYFGSDWCDVHNIFVENDANGDGAYIYLTANATRDMRVLDISGQHGGSVDAPTEIGRYTLPGASYIHDITVLDHSAHTDGRIGRRVYISYWERGLVILDAADVTPGTNPTPVVAADRIDPAGFRTHHAMASPDGTLVFIQDEFLYGTGNEPVQMWNVTDPTNPVYVDGLRLGVDAPENTAHNLEMRWDLDPDRLFVGWYKLGLQAWDYTADGFVRNHPAPRTAAIYHQVQTGATDSIYSGAWGVRLAEIGDGLYVFQSDYRYGLVIDCLICPSGEDPTPTATTMQTATSTITPPINETATPTATLVTTPTATPAPPHVITATVTPTGSVTPVPTLTPTPTATLPMTLTAMQRVVLDVDADGNGAISPGDRVSVTVTIRNGLDTTLEDVHYHETFGPHLYALTDSVQSSQGGIVPPGTALLPHLLIEIGAMDPEAIVTIQFAVQLNQTIPLAIRDIPLQGTVSAAGMDPVLTDNADTPTVHDPTRLRIVHGDLSETIFLPIGLQ